MKYGNWLIHSRRNLRNVSLELVGDAHPRAKDHLPSLKAEVALQIASMLVQRILKRVDLQPCMHSEVGTLCFGAH